MRRSRIITKLIWVLTIIFMLSLCSAYALNKEDDEFYEAVQSFLDGSYNSSLKLFAEFISLYPKSLKVPSAKLYEVKVLYSQGQYSRAWAAINELLFGKYPGNLEDDIYYWCARIKYSLREYNSALKYSYKIIHDYPQSNFLWPANYILAQIYLDKNKITAGKALLKKITEAAGDKNTVNNAYNELLDIYYRGKDYSQIKVLASRYLKRWPYGKLRDKMYFYRAKSFYNNADYHKAVVDYTAALTHSPGSEEKDLIYQGRGLCFIALDDTKKAKNDFAKIKSLRQRLFSYGIYYFKVKDYVHSLNSLSAFLDKFPRSDNAALAYLNKAESLYCLGRIRDALYTYRKIIDGFNTSLGEETVNEAYYGMGWCYLKSGEFTKSIEAFKNTISSTNDATVKMNSEVRIADVYMAANNLPKALAQYNKILKDYPNGSYGDYVYFQIGIIMLKQNKFYEAISNFIRIENKFPASRFLSDAEYYMGVAYLAVDDFDKAAQALGDFIAKYPHNHLIRQAYYLYGKSLMGKRDYSKALILFAKVLHNTTKKETKELAYIATIRSYYQLGNFNCAGHRARNFLKLFPHSLNRSLIYLYLGRIYQHQCAFDQAKYFYKKILEGHKTSSVYKEAILSLGVLYMRKGLFVLAQSYFKMLEPGNGSLSFKAKLYLADIDLQKDKRKLALDIYKELAQGKGKTARLALVKEAFLLKDMGKYSQVIKVFREVIAKYGDSARIRFALGFSLEKINKINDSIAEYLKVVYNFNAVGFKIKAYFRLARIYERQGNIAKAKNMYRKIIATGRGEAKVAQVKLNNLSSD